MDTQNLHSAAKIVTAGLAVIGNEILSGRTLDTNTQTIAQKLTARGITLSDVRIVPDKEARIIEAVNVLRAENDYVFTTGGIGPTHDDITAASIAKAFGVALEENDEAMAMLQTHYRAKGQEVTLTRARMAQIPIGASLIPNPVSGAPGFCLENVYVIAGVPNIMKAMLDHVVPGLAEGDIIHSITVEAYLAESELANDLSDLQIRYPDVEIGSYPKIEDGMWRAAIVMRGVNRKRLEKAERDLANILADKSQKTR